ncbi:zonadhesin-like [Branchiostoma floridae x Branchiostoma belcheri]
MTVCEALECPANSTYSTCTSACPATCANHIPGNCEECYEGCGCDPGYLKSGPNITNINCVLPADCGCTSNGLYHPLGSVWLEGDELCACHAGNRTVCIVTSESGAVGASVGAARIMVCLFVAIFLVTEWH